ncbi:MAG: 4-hydroxy-3-methylbut-2-enyl diphosphate reductase [Corallococcus sp.]|nr:4-hydroxy-3-methylbut-2-enyl diphosphate reductase [Corallococcus sp.]
MKFYIYKNYGFCSGVNKAVSLAKRNAENKPLYALGELVHNENVLRELELLGVLTVKSPRDIPVGQTAIIRAHGVSPDIIEECKQRNLNIIDATCPYVARIQKRAREYYLRGYQVILVGNAEHPEIVGINGWCNNTAILTDGKTKLHVGNCEKAVIMFQTTFDSALYQKSLQNILIDNVKTLEIFNTICYTTIDRQNYAHFVVPKSDLVVIVGDRNSSNTMKLYDVAVKYGKDVLLLSDLNVPDVDLSKYNIISFISGASTPKELMEGVLERMSEIAKENVEIENVSSNESAMSKNKEMFAKAVSEIKEGKRYRAGQRVKCRFELSDDNGVYVQLDNWKGNAYIPNEQLTMEDDYLAVKSSLKQGDVLDCLVLSTDNGKIMLSKKAIEERFKDDALVEGIKNGEQFEITVAKTGKECLVGRLGSYTVIVHASQIKLGFVKNLEPYVGKKLRLIANPDKIDETKKLIFASQKAILLAEKQEKEDAFWNNIEVNEIVEGKVLRFAPFGAFVSVRDFDCLAHTSDLSWDRIVGPEDVLQVGETYEFVVLALDREKNRVSLGYKQLQPKPWEIAAEKYAAGSIVKGKVARIMPFGAFVELDSHIDGLLHISNVSWEWLDDINKALKVGDEIEVEVLEFDAENKRITLSRKAVLPKPEMNHSTSEE